VSSLRQDLINDLVYARLLSIHLEKIGPEQVEVEFVNIIHDTLILNWELLMDSIKEKRDQLKHRIRFEQELFAWKSENNSEDYLLTGSHLREARELNAAGDIALQNESANRFYTQSIQKERSRELRALFWRSIPAGSVGGGIGFGLASILILFNQRLEDAQIIFLTGLFVNSLIGLFSVGLICSLGITFAQLLPMENPPLARWFLGGLGGVLGFCVALLLFSSVWPSQGRSSLGMLLLEGIVWGLASGLSLTWGLTSSRHIWLKLLLISLFAGSALVIGEFFGQAFLLNDPVAVPAVWQLFIAGALVPVFIFVALSIVNRQSPVENG
jgi:hypothetical protein